MVHTCAEAKREFKKAEETSPCSLHSLGGLAYIFHLEAHEDLVGKMLPELRDQGDANRTPMCGLLQHMSLKNLLPK